MYPLMIDLSEKKVLIVGAGNIALRKAKGILQANGRRLRVIAPVCLPEFYDLSTAGSVEIVERVFQKGDTKGFDLIFICTDKAEINKEILAEIEPYQWVNDTMNKQNGNFHNMAVLQNEEIGLAITSFGKSPDKTKKVKKELSRYLDNLHEKE